MAIAISLLFLIFNLLATLQQSNCNPLNNNFAEDVKKFKSYIEEIKGNLNTSVNPCDDFEKYVCGNTDDKIEIYEENINTIFYSNETVKKYLRKPKTELEKKIVNFDKKCSAAFNKEDNEIVKEIFKKVDIFIEAGALPTKREYSPKEIVELTTLQYPLGEPTFIDFTGELTLDKNNNLYVLKFDNSLLSRFNETHYKQLFKMTGSKEEDIESAIKDIKIFTNKLNEIDELYDSDELMGQNETIYLESFDEFKKKFPSKNWDWNELADYFKKIFNSNFKYKIVVKKVKLLEAFLKVIDSTNSNIVANFLLLAHLDNFLDGKCELIEKFFTFAIVSHVWNEFFTDKVKHHYMKFLDKFELQFNKTIKESDDLEFYNHEQTMNSNFYNILENYRNIVKNNSNFDSPDFLTTYYGNFDFDTSNIYQNIFNSTSKLLLQLEAFNEPEIFTSIGGSKKFEHFPELIIYERIIDLGYDEEFDSDDDEQLLFYYDSLISFNFWHKYYNKFDYDNFAVEKYPCLENFNDTNYEDYEHEKELENDSSLENVSDTSHEYYEDEEEYEYKYFEYLNVLKAIKSSFKNMKFDKVTTHNIGEDVAWATPSKLFFISIAQKNCNNNDFFMAIKYSNEFMNSFKCSKENTNFIEFNKCYNV